MSSANTNSSSDSIPPPSSWFQERMAFANHNNSNNNNSNDNSTKVTPKGTSLLERILRSKTANNTTPNEVNNVSTSTASTEKTEEKKARYVPPHARKAEDTNSNNTSNNNNNMNNSDSIQHTPEKNVDKVVRPTSPPSGQSPVTAEERRNTTTSHNEHTPNTSVEPSLQDGENSPQKTAGWTSMAQRLKSANRKGEIEEPIHEENPPPSEGWNTSGSVPPDLSHTAEESPSPPLPPNQTAKAPGGKKQKKKNKNANVEGTSTTATENNNNPNNNNPNSKPSAKKKKNNNNNNPNNNNNNPNNNNNNSNMMMPPPNFPLLDPTIYPDMNAFPNNNVFMNMMNNTNNNNNMMMPPPMFPPYNTDMNGVNTNNNNGNNNNAMRNNSLFTDPLAAASLAMTDPQQYYYYLQCYYYYYYGMAPNMNLNNPIANNNNNNNNNNSNVNNPAVPNGSPTTANHNNNSNLNMNNNRNSFNNNNNNNVEVPPMEIPSPECFVNNNNNNNNNNASNTTSGPNSTGTRSSSAHHHHHHHHHSHHSRNVSLGSVGNNNKSPASLNNNINIAFPSIAHNAMNNNNMNNSAPNSNNNNTGLMGNTPTGPTLFPFAPTVPLYDFLSVLPYFIESCLLLTEEEYARREKLFQNIEAIAKSYLTFQTELRVHGSVTTGLALPSSDIDLLMIHYNPPFMPLEALKTLATAIVFADDVLLSEALARKRMVEEEEREATHLLRTIGRGDNMFLQVEEEEQAKEAPQEGRSDSDSPPRVPSSLASPIPDRQHPAVLDREGSYPFILLGEKEEMESSQRVERSRPDHGEMSSNNNNNNSSSSAVGQEAIKTFNELVRQNKKSSKDRKEEEGEGSADHSSDPDSDDEEKDEEDDPTDTVHYTTKEEVHAAERIFRRQIEKEYEFTAQRDVLKAVSSLFQQSSAMRPQEEQKPHSGSDSSEEEGSELDANDDTKHFDEEEVMALPPKEGTSTPARTVVCPPPPLPPAPPQLFTSTLDPNSTRGRRQVPVIEGQLYTVQAILTTRVPVIKMVEKETHMKADITFAGGDHYRSMKLIQSLVERYPHSQYFILFFKYCVQCLQIGEHAEGGVTSFVVYLLVMHFFNTCEQRVVQSLVEQEEEVAARKTSADTTTTVTVQTNLTDNSNVELRTGDSHNNNNDNRPPPNTNTNTNNKTGMNCLQGIVDSFFKKNHKNVANQDQTAIEQTILSFLGEEHSKNSNNNNGEDDRVSNSSRIGSPSTLKTISDGEHQEGFPAVQAEPKEDVNHNNNNTNDNLYLEFARSFIRDEVPFAKLFIDFCIYYGVDFNYDTYGIHFYGDGSGRSETIVKPFYCVRRGQFCHLTSPLEEELDLTARMTCMSDFQWLCWWLVQCSTEGPVPCAPMPMPKGPLGAVATTDENNNNNNNNLNKRRQEEFYTYNINTSLQFVLKNLHPDRSEEYVNRVHQKIRSTTIPDNSHNHMPLPPINRINPMNNNNNNNTVNFMNFNNNNNNNNMFDPFATGFIKNGFHAYVNNNGNNNNKPTGTGKKFFYAKHVNSDVNSIDSKPSPQS